ncbi:MAG TPA: TonB family protein, partial [Hellea balneolensis]|nr:TonB family protein [Hellea balneolensis]
RITNTLLSELDRARVKTPAPEPAAAPAKDPAETAPETVVENTQAQPAPSQEGNEPVLQASLGDTATTVPQAQTPVEVSEPEPAKPVKDLIVEAKRISGKSPVYPGVANRRGYDRDVTIVVTYSIDDKGHVINAQAAETNGAGRYKRAFERAALEAVNSFKFEPKTINGKAILSSGHSTKISFKVE